MKGPMVTQTLQDIIGHEPFHWQADRKGLEEFAATFRDLQGADSPLSDAEMREFKDYLSTIYFPPNPYQSTNEISTPISIKGFQALGRDLLPRGAQLPDAIPSSPGCGLCHREPTGLGRNSAFPGSPLEGRFNRFQTAPNQRAEGRLIKIPQLRSVHEKSGLRYDSTNSTAGFGFLHDGRADTLEKLLQDGYQATDTDDALARAVAASLISGPSTSAGSLSITNHHAHGLVGRQLEMNSPAPVDWFPVLVSRALIVPIELIVRSQSQTGAVWVFDRTSQVFQSNRKRDKLSSSDLLARFRAGPDQGILTVVAQGVARSAIDADADGILDQDETELGSDPLDPASRPLVTFQKFERLSGAVQFTVNTMPGYRHQIQFAVSLNPTLNNQWQNIGLNFAADSRQTNRFEPITTTREQYYRVIVTDATAP